MATSGVELAVGYISITAETSRIARDVRRALDQAEQDADRSGQRMGSGMAGGIGDQLKGLGALAIGGTIGAALMTGVSSAIEGEALGDKLSASLGATEADSQRYGAIAGKVFAGAYGENMGEVSAAIDAVASSLKGVGGIQLDDSGIQSATQKALDFASVYGTEVTESVQTVSQLVGNGLASSADEGFDLLVTAYQKVPAAMRDELPEILNEYGTNFSALGFDGQEAFNLLVGAAQQGKFALDKTGDALKEFTIRGSDMSKASADAYASVGLDAVAMSNAVATGGDAAQDAMQKTASAILGIEDPATRANTAIALFGTPLEDLSVDQIPAFLESLTGASNGLGEVGGAADRMGATLADNASTKIEMFKRAVGQGLTNLAGNVIIPALGDAFTEIGNIFGPVITEVSGGITALVAAFQDGGDEVTSSGFAGFLEQIGITARNLYDGFNTTVLPMIKDFGAIALDVGQAVLPVLWTAFQTGVGVVNSIIAAITSVVGWFTQHKDVAIALGAVIATAVLPTLITLGITLAASAISWGVNAIAIQGYLIAVRLFSGIAKVAAAGQWLLNAAMSANPIGIVVVAIVALVAAIVLAYRNSETFRNIVQAAWEGIQTAVSVVWGFLQGIFASFMQGIRDIGAAATWLYDNGIKPAFDGIQTAIGFVWGLIEGYFNLWKMAFTAIGDAAMWLYNNAIQPAFDGVGTVIGAVLAGAQTGFDIFMTALGKVGDFVSSVVGGIGAVWDGLKAMLAKPVNFLINTVWNNGILKAWNAVADFLPGLEPASPLAGIPEYARGGSVHGRGTGTSDDIPALLSNGEHVWTAREVQAAGGHEEVMKMRVAALKGGPALYSTGGPVDLNAAPWAGGGGEANLKPAAILARRNIHKYWPEIGTIGGYRASDPYPDHPSGLALDVMTGDPVGTQVNDWLHAQMNALGLNYTIWKQFYKPAGGTGNMMEDRGSITQNHWDHIHALFNANGVPGIQDGGVGSSAIISSANQESFLQSKIDEVFDAIVAPIRSGMTAVIGAPPPQYLDIPPQFLNTGTDLASDFLGETVGGLGDALSSVWQGAQSLVGNLFDNGGVMPHGSIGVNMSGKPEAVLTNKEWSRLQGLSANLASGSASRPGNGLTESESRGGRNAPLIGSVNTTVDEQGLLGVIRRAQMFDERSLVG